MASNPISTDAILETLSSDRAELFRLLVGKASSQSNNIEHYPRGATSGPCRLPASRAQQRLWFIDQLEGTNSAYYIPLVLPLRGALDQAALRRALDEMVQRHEALRTVFVSVNGEPLQEVAPEGHFTLQTIDLENESVDARASRIRIHELEEAHAPFDLSAGPLIRGRLLRIDHREHVLIVALHHIISDGWSVGIFVRELSALYGACAKGQKSPLEPLPIQYADYAQWQRDWLKSPRLESQLNDWRSHLRGLAPQLELPTDRPRPPVQSYRGDSIQVSLGTPLTNAVKALAQRHDLTLFMVLCAAWAILLHRLSGQEDVALGTPVANRGRSELEGLIGFFVNTLVLRLAVRDDLSVEAFLREVRKTTLQAYSHQDVPFEKIVEVLQPERSLSRNPLFQVMFAFQNAPTCEFRAAGVSGALEGSSGEWAMFDLLLSLQETRGDIAGIINFATDLFDRATIERWVTSFTVVLESLTEDVRIRIDELPVLSARDRRRVVETFNATGVAFPRDLLVHQLFEEQVRRTPDATALIYEQQSLTYSELNRKANQLAHCLRKKGIGPDHLVGICLRRSLEMVVGLLGTLKAGGAYVPLDPDYPAERLHYMLQDSAPGVLLTSGAIEDRLPPMRSEVVSLDSGWSSIAGESDTDPDPDPQEIGLTAHNLAYVIYTSGSTGRPKGAMNEHRGVVNRIQWMQERYALTPNDRVLQKTPFSFDVSVWEFFWPLMTGARLVVARPEGHQDPDYLRSLIEETGITTLHFVPSMLQAFLNQHEPGRCASILHVVCSGEELPVSLEAKCLECLPQALLSNLYGPTEAAVDVTAWECQGSTGVTRVPIGKPIANARMYVLDARRQPVPIGVIGEIYIGGVAVGRGYLNQPQLTTERFVADPFSSDPRARLYRTGDLGRWRPDGVIEYFGRNDHQVKIRGFRIELGEIEAQLTRHSLVRDAVVVVREDHAGEKRLVAYVTGSGGSRPAVGELRAQLKGLLPEYMIPGAFVILDELPLTPNGKLDRRALPAPDMGALATRPYERPQGEVEEVLAGLWQELLHVERVGRHDNFFELGGHSLLIVQLLDRMRRVGLTTNVRKVYESRTLADMAGRMTGAPDTVVQVPPNLIPGGATAITPEMLTLIQLDMGHIARIADEVPGGAGNIQDIYPLAPLQEGILFHHLLKEEGPDTYLASCLLLVASRERLDRLVGALQTVIDRHDILRTAILWERLPQPVQVVLRNATVRVEQVELDPTREPREQIRDWGGEGKQRLDLRSAPLMRLLTAPDPRGGPPWYALLQLHHVVGDNTSQEIIISEVVRHLEGRAGELPEPVPYRNHVAQALALSRTDDSEAYFRGKLGSITEPTAPFGVLDLHGDGSHFEQAVAELGPELAKQVRLEARRFGVSAATLFHAAWALVVAHTSSRTDVVYGTVLLGRLQGTAGAQRILGMFINTLPLTAKLQGASAKDLVEQIQQELVQLICHEQASLAVSQRCSGLTGTTPLFTALLNFRHEGVDPGAELSGSVGVTLLDSHSGTNYPLLLSVDDLGEGFRISVDADRRIDPHRVLAYTRTAIHSLIDALEAAPQTPALQLPVLPESETEQVIRSFNSTAADYPCDRMIHELFEKQASEAPGALALMHGEQRMTYDELNRRANQLARYLVNCGVRPDGPVGICAGRGINMVIGVLAILKAGGAYLPLDPSYPTDRLRNMLDDAAPAVVLVETQFIPLLSPTSTQVVPLELALLEVARHVDENLSPAELGLRPEHLLYTIYTSGSTGRPKGTAMPHRAMVNLIEWHRRMLPAHVGQRVLQFAALSFDVAFQEIFSSLCTGCTLVLLEEWIRRDVRAFRTFLQSRSIERLFLPPLMLQALAEHVEVSQSVPGSLKDVIVAGEQLRISPEIADFFGRLPGARLHNHYGPTETHVVTALTLTEDPHKWPVLPSIGRPISNIQIYVLDPRGEPVGIGVVGEIHIAGTGVARGYLGRADLTSQRFVRDPCSAEQGARMYRTGDLGRWRADGTLDYLGRNDHQLKIRGYRIELGEIETLLTHQESIREAVVAGYEDPSGGKRLVAYIVPREGQVSAEDLREHLKARLPDYMIPTAFVTLSGLPLTPNGKLDRKALPVPEMESSGTQEGEPPRGETENAVAEIWRKLLRLERVGRSDNFFELGGHSLLAMRLTVSLEHTFGLHVPVSAVFQNPTVGQMAELLESLRGATLAPDHPELIGFEQGVL